MSGKNISMVSEWKEDMGDISNDEHKVPLLSLSKLTGFPVDFIKKELVLEEEELSMSDLRATMLNYLNDKMNQFKDRE